MSYMLLRVALSGICRAYDIQTVALTGRGFESPGYMSGRGVGSTVGLRGMKGAVFVFDGGSTMEDNNNRGQHTHEEAGGEVRAGRCVYR